MVIDVESPEPPDLTNRGVPADVAENAAFDSVGDLRRAELETALAEGAWTEAFEEWASYTDLTDAEYEAIRKRGLFQRLDFFWDPIEEHLDFSVPEGWSTDDDLSALAIGELREFASLVVETLEDGYLAWGESPENDVWRSEPFSDDTSPEE